MAKNLVAPQAVADLAQYVGIGGDAPRRLLTDPRMTNPWQEIVKRAQHLEQEEPAAFHHRLDGLDHRLQPVKWVDGWRRTDWERAVCAVFLAVACECAVPKRSVRRQKIEGEVQRWRTGAALCREAQDVPHRARIDPELARVLQTAANYFDHWGDFMEGAKAGPSVIERGTRKLGQRGGDDDVRVRVRAVSRHILNVLGTALDGSVAAISNVVFDCKVDRSVVANWSSER
jgi:hypothetical protein